MFENRKKISFLVIADLTKRRNKLLKFCRHQCESSNYNGGNSVPTTSDDELNPS